MKCFVSNYHISVNRTLVQDLQAIGLEVVMPSNEFAPGRIDFFAPNDEHLATGAKLIGYDEFLGLEPMAIITPCVSMVDDFKNLLAARGNKDVSVFLTANSDAKNIFDLNGTDYLMTHDLDFHRACSAKYKILYFSRPTILRPKKTEAELKKSYEEKKLKLYINNFDKHGFEPEYANALGLREIWKDKTGWEIPFYGYEMPAGWPSMAEVQDHMVDSMFTVIFKRRETWGQMANESFLLGTPGVFLRQFIYSTFKEYLISDDTAIVGDSVPEIVDKMLSLTFEQYETLVNECYSQSDMFCNDLNRRIKLRWLFDKIAQDEKILAK